MMNPPVENKPARRITLPEELTIHQTVELLERIKRYGDTPLEVDCSALAGLDSAGISLLHYLQRRRDNVELKNIPSHLESHLKRFSASGVVNDRSRQPKRDQGIAAYLGEKIRRKRRSVFTYLSLMADTIYYSGGALFKRRGIYPGSITHQVYYMGYDSFPIVCLISFLIGVTIALSSAGQLNRFGADIYLADIVGFGMIRELVPLMTGVILAGKIGASITAEVSSMKVLEEVDALTTMGIVPHQFIMAPKVLAISVAVPLLVAMADLVGIMGGVLAGRLFSGIPVGVFMERMLQTVDIGDFGIGMVKMLIFGWIVVFTAGYKGFSVGQGAQGVGRATTESVVLSISLIIAIDCIFALILY